VNLSNTLVKTRGRRSGLFNPVGRRNAVVVTDVLNGFTSTITLCTTTPTQLAELELLLESVQPLLLQLGTRTNCDLGVFNQEEAWVSVIRVIEAHLADRQSYTERGWELEVIQVDRPPDTTYPPIV